MWCKAKSWGIVELCWGKQRWTVIFVVLSLSFSLLPQRILLGPALGHSIVCCCICFCIMPICRASQSFHFHFTSSLSHYIFFFVFFSWLFLKITQTLLMLSKPVELRPPQRKWQLRMTATWSHMRPRRWWQVQMNCLMQFLLYSTLCCWTIPRSVKWQAVNLCLVWLHPVCLRDEVINIYCGLTTLVNAAGQTSLCHFTLQPWQVRNELFVI